MKFLHFFLTILFFFCACKSDASVTGIYLSQNNATLTVGSKLDLEVTIFPEDATDKRVIWKSSAPAIASVTVYGQITAIAPGTTVVTVTTNDGNKTAECKITVLQPISESNPAIITGYIPEYRINIATPGDLSYLGIPDRVYFFGIYPTSSGEWQLFSSISPKVNIVRAVMRDEQELFVVAGGGASATPNMHVMGNDASKREAYAEALVNYAHQNNFDGIDIDWETDWSKSPAQKVNKVAYVDLMTRIRNKMSALPESTRVKKLTTALATQNDSRELGLAVVNIVDQINVMVYDVYGTQAEGYPHAPISMFKTGLENYVNAGIPKQKILGGVPFYGGNKTVSPTQHKAYRDIYNEAYPSLTESMNVWNNFAFNGADLIREKIRYVISNGYAGMMIWELYQDTPYENELSLLRAMKQAVNEMNKYKNE